MGDEGLGNSTGGENNNTPPVIPNDDPDLPENLRGKSTAEIVRYYQDREATLTTRIEQAQRSNNNVSPEPPADPSAAEFWNDPSKAVKAVAVSREEFNAASESVRRSMVIVAQIRITSYNVCYTKLLRNVNTELIRHDVSPFMVGGTTDHHDPPSMPTDHFTVVTKRYG